MYFWLWLSVLIVSVVIELLTVGNLISIWFALGSLAAMVANELSLNFYLQAIIFILFSIISLLVFRPLATKYLRGNIVKTNADRALGQVVKLLEPITQDTWGSVKVNGVIWHCISYDNKEIAIGESVKVLAIEGAKLIVKKV